MSYEIVFYYHEKTTNGYDKDVSKELKKKLGKPYEEISMNILSSYILTQLARRDIFIYNYEVFEYKKQKINCKETKDGIVIKGKKFTFDGKVIDSYEEYEQEEYQNSSQFPHNKAVAKNILNNFNNTKVLKYVTPDPEIHLFDKLTKSLGFKFTKNKKYPVFKEAAGSMIGLYNYIIQDDKNNKISCSSEYFLPAKIVYEKDESIDSFDSSEKITETGDINLSYGNEYNDQMIDVRKLKR